MTRPGYRPELDGLRTVAVAAVILYHAEISVGGWYPFKGGFLGVDLFFVISGYLITGIIIGDLTVEKFSLVRFYERRARRVLPALFLVMLSSLFFAWTWMTAAQLDNFSRSMIATVLFSSNFFFWLDTNYFSEAMQLKPLSHTWSLGVEEQFYILFPLILRFAYRRGYSVTKILLMIIALSLLLSFWLGKAFGEAVFYLIPTRAWELAAGAALAATERDVGRIGTPALNHVIPIVALGCLGYAIARFDANYPQPVLFNLLLVTATMGLIWFTGRDDMATRLLSSPLMRGGGLISYSLYLWHQPVLAFARLYSIHRPSRSEYLALIGATVIVAYLSWRFVEQPFRRPVTNARRTVWVASGAWAALLTLVGGLCMLLHGVPSRMPVIEAVPGDAAHYMHCALGDCIGAAGVNPTIAIVGDSHAGVLLRSMEGVLRQEGRAAYVRAAGDSYVDRYPAFYRSGDRYTEILDDTKSLISADGVRTIILSARYTLRIENTPFDNGEGGVEILPDFFDGRTPEQKESLASSIYAAILDLIGRGKRVVIVYPIPEAGWNVPSILTKVQIRGLDDDLSTSYDLYLRRNAVAIGLFDAIPDAPNVLKVRPDRILCNTFIVGRCATHLGFTSFYSDDNHLSTAGANLVVAEITKIATEKWGGLGE